MYRAASVATVDLERVREVARGAALVGGEVVRSGRRPAEGEAKGLPGDWVTEVDLASEHAIRAYLGAETPDMMGEPFGKSGGTNTMKIVKVGELRRG